MSTTISEDNAAEPDRVSGAALRAVMRHVPTPVTVVTARTEMGAPIGVTIGSFASVSLQPPLVSFNVSEEARAYGWLDGGRFAVHILRRDQSALAERFAEPGSPPEQQFEGVAWQPEGAYDVPVIGDVLAVLHCRLHARFPAGDSDVVVGRVERVQDRSDSAAERAAAAAADPLVYHRRGYGTVASALDEADPEAPNRSGTRAPETPAPNRAKS